MLEIEKEKSYDSFFATKVNCQDIDDMSIIDVWYHELDMLYITDKICRKYEIKYFLSFGSLIGAMRHNGFIPWDDDIDICMLRNDYNRFMEVAPKELPDYLFLQNPNTDKDYYYRHAKLRNSNTTAIRASDLNNRFPFNQGIFLDIFPMDAVPNSKFLKTIQYVGCWIYYKYMYFGVQYDYSKNHPFYGIIAAKFFRTIYRAIGLKRSHKYFEKWITMFNNRNHKQVCVSSNFYHINYSKNKYYDVKWFDKITDKSFEFINVCIPECYDDFLKLDYTKEWRIPKKVSSGHGSVIFNTKLGSDEYLKKLDSKKE